MKTEELRIGNWIQDDEGVPCQVLMIGMGNFRVSLDKGVNNNSPSAFEPIPLTPEILLACGFTTDESKVEYRIGLPIGEGEDLFIEDEGHPSMSCGIEDDKHFNYFKDVRSLHQLQNLYFALTGTELSYSPHKIK